MNVNFHNSARSMMVEYGWTWTFNDDNAVASSGRIVESLHLRWRSTLKRVIFFFRLLWMADSSEMFVSSNIDRSGMTNIRLYCGSSQHRRTMSDGSRGMRPFDRWSSWIHFFFQRQLSTDFDYYCVECSSSRTRRGTDSGKCKLKRCDRWERICDTCDSGRGKKIEIEVTQSKD